MSDGTNEAGNSPSDMQKDVNKSLYFGITEDFEGWYLKGIHTYIWKLKKLTAAGLKPIREAEAAYAKIQEDGLAGKVSSYEVDTASDSFAKQIFEFGLQDFIDEDWTALINDEELSRGDISDCAAGLYLFLVRITTKRSAMRLLLQPASKTPLISDINRGYRKSGSSLSLS